MNFSEMFVEDSTSIVVKQLASRFLAFPLLREAIVHADGNTIHTRHGNSSIQLWEIELDQCSYPLSSITLRKFPANSRAILTWDTLIPVLRNALFLDIELDLSSLQIETGR